MRPQLSREGLDHGVLTASTSSGSSLQFACSPSSAPTSGQQPTAEKLLWCRPCAAVPAAQGVQTRARASRRKREPQSSGEAGEQMHLTAAGMSTQTLSAGWHNEHLRTDWLADRPECTNLQAEQLTCRRRRGERTNAAGDVSAFCCSCLLLCLPSHLVNTASPSASGSMHQAGQRCTNML